ncbi:protein kinase domain-containing protein [Actinomadura mexicana]|uniref:Serine/threonine protein kinase n=1 Tax=Actinomadura mexicana TaxID=134959 RepID=A0A238ULJ5_9ACTN|nr:serine/threonine-protein kinase [Actinomadura mexicana]SNR22986.1 Serine/threonine protein kinase [Actinomadura mexicana]
MGPLQPGDPVGVGGYRVLARLGAGGMGVVYLARSPGGRLAALKLIRSDSAGDPGFRERFRREIAAAGKVSGLYTAPVLDADADAPQPWFAAAFVPALTLKEAVEDGGALPEPAVRALGAGLAEALQAVHGAGLVHRDLKPGNVLLAEDGPKIIDFGIAKVVDATQITRTGGMIGTLAYLAPEQIAGAKDAGPGADVFALGGVLVYAATGARPFGEGDPGALLYEIMYGEPGLDGLPASLRSILAACLDKEPARRPPLADVLAALTPADPSALISPALRRALAAREAEANRISSGPVTLPPPLPRIEEAVPGGLRRRRVLGLAAGAAVAVTGMGAGTAGWALAGGKSKPARPAPRGTALAAAPAPAWTFVPPASVSSDDSHLLVADGVVLWGGDDATYGVDAASGRRLWTADVRMFAGCAVHGSTLILPNGGGTDDEKTTITLVDAASGEPTHLPMPDGAFPGSVFGVAGGAVLLESGTYSDEDSPAVWAVELAGGKARWRLPLADSVVEGAVDRNGLYLNVEHTLSAVDLATGRRRRSVDWSRSGQDWPTQAIAVAGGRVFGNFADTLQAVDTAGGKTVWSRATGADSPSVLLAAGKVIFRGDDLHAHDRATGAPAWTLAGPAKFVDEPGHDAASDDVLAAAFSDGSTNGFFAATASGRGLWAHWGDVPRAEDWDVVVSGSSIFATDHQRLLCFRADS